MIGCSNGEETSNETSNNNNEHTQSQEQDETHNQQEKPSPDDSERQLPEEKAIDILQKYKETFMVETSANGDVQDFESKKEIVNHYKSIMSTDLAEAYVNQYFKEESGNLKIIATEAPIWFDETQPFQFENINDSTYHVIQERQSELYGHKEFTFELTYSENNWVVNRVKSDEIGFTKEEAEELVRREANIEIGTETKVAFDHKKDGQFIIHVYDVIENDGTTHNATRGWFKVDPEAKQVTNMFDNQEHITTVIKEKGQEIVNALSKGEMENVSTYVHPEKGLLISPHIYIDQDAIVLKKQEVANVLQNKNEYTWGYHDGSGKPMISTPKEYFKRYENFINADEITVDNIKQRGNTSPNIKETFPESHVVEFYLDGTSENNHMDWSSLYIVFEMDAHGEWKAVAFVSDHWSI